ncbi:hypothetical protein KDA_51500 [Dictyobacter alpinus]|uniref:Uncharacterized protein n=1 Tax=Dictyobacter alpinus TaxID=2014873 RepID=A0A402BED0_9CHLR|nr:hypothetical protein [Dictyobacter alpinus]GCE29666.1 hypothetical protein KDA_51500 [Dictyobacter alpinus]
MLLTIIFVLAQTPLVMLDAVPLLLMVWLLLSANYWGPLLVADHQQDRFVVLKASITFTWRYPGQTLLTGIIVLLALGIGIGSVAGFFVIIPIFITLLQQKRYLWIVEREERKQNGTSGKPRVACDTTQLLDNKERARLRHKIAESV